MKYFLIGVMCLSVIKSSLLIGMEDMIKAVQKLTPQQRAELEDAENRRRYDEEQRDADMRRAIFDRGGTEQDYHKYLEVQYDPDLQEKVRNGCHWELGGGLRDLWPLWRAKDEDELIPEMREVRKVFGMNNEENKKQ